MTENRVINLVPAPVLRYPLFCKRLVALGPLLLCVAVAHSFPPWIFMWLLALSIFIGAKWVTVRDGLPLRNAPGWRLAVYLFLWPGLNPRFCYLEGRAPARGEWIVALANTILGAAMVWGVLRFLPPGHFLLVGWIGMVGLVLSLHFGIFHLLSNAWRAAGFNAPPLMAHPLRATSLAEFWGGRWNKAFNDLMVPHVFAPLARRFGAAIAAVAVFLFSGLLHELVISVPACGGFGWPTFYFAVQATGLVIERSGLGRKLGLGNGPGGWLFTVAVTAGPAYWLFPPIFVRNVILPMLRAIGAI